MLNVRLYRAAWLPAVVAVAVAALSLTNRPAPLGAGAGPNAFEGAWTLAELRQLDREFPRRPAGSGADARLGNRVAQTIEGLGPASSGGFHVSSYRSTGQTIYGSRSLVTVVATRPGTTSEGALVVVAHRDTPWAGSEADLSGTAVLLGLARALSTRQTARTVALVSTSGGSGGDAGATSFAALVDGGNVPWLTGAQAPESEAGGSGGPVDAALVLGNLAPAGALKPEVVPFSEGYGSAPTQLAETVEEALDQQSGAHVRPPGAFAQFAHLALPLTSGEQGPLNAAGVPAVMIEAAGEGRTAARAAVTAAGLETLGAATLGALEALDNGPEASAQPQTGLVFAQKILPSWAVRLLVGALLLPALLVAVDAAARVRRRREGLARGLAFTLACTLPAAAAAAVLVLMGMAGLAGAAPATPVAPGAVRVGILPLATIALALAAAALASLVAARMVTVLARRAETSPGGSGVGMMLVLDAVAVISWVVDPYAALLLIPAVHLWMLVAAPELRPQRRGLGLAVVLLGVCAPASLALYYTHQLATGAVGAIPTAVALVASGRFGAGTVALWAAAAGCAVAAVLLALSRNRERRADGTPVSVSIRGPLTYAGPGSLGGTNSALRR